jgi:beta-lactamase superfamily II metal-dependent hydrolase
MRVDIFDVGHGQCAVVTAPNGRRMMLDCGDRWEELSFWTPSLHYLREKIDVLVLMNLDEDHISDFDGMTKDCTVPWVLSNPTVGPLEFALLKMDGMGAGAKAVAAWLGRPRTASPAATQPDFGFVQIRYYYGLYDYVHGAVNNTNDLSLAVVVQFGAFKIVFAGDLEIAGWRRLLSLPSFRQDLVGTTIFVASHHGRESGCCTELFDLFRPQLVIISDDARRFDSQDTDDWYRARCTGAVFVTNPSDRRYVATTRKDGAMRIKVDPTGRWTIERVSVRDWPRKPDSTLPQGLGLGGLAALAGDRNSLPTGIGTLLTGLPTPPISPRYESGFGVLESLNNGSDPFSRALGLGPFLRPTLTKR